MQLLNWESMHAGWLCLGQRLHDLQVSTIGGLLGSSCMLFANAIDPYFLSFTICCSEYVTARAAPTICFRKRSKEHVLDPCLIVA